MSRMFSFLSVALTAGALSAGLSGCDGNKQFASVSQPANFHPDGRALPSAANLPNLKLSISADKTTYKTGDTIHLTIAVTNTDAGNPHVISFTSGSHTTWWGYVIAQNGKIVSYEYWPGHKLAFPQVIGTDSYAPGETHTFPYDFPFVPSTDSPPQVSVLPPGTYQIYARYPDTLFDAGAVVNNGVPTPVSEALTITVTP